MRPEEKKKRPSSGPETGRTAPRRDRSKKPEEIRGRAAEASAGKRKKPAGKPGPGKPPRRKPAAAEARPVRRRRAPEPKQPRRQEPAPAVVYTPGAAFDRRRFLLKIATVTAVVLALTGVLSLFFKVRKVTVSGNEKYDGWTIREASGIQDGDGLLSIGQARASGRIIAALPYVRSVQIGIKLPDTVNIKVEEVDVVYAASAKDGSWWLITSEGRVVEQLMNPEASGAAKILGTTLAVPVGEQAQAYEPPNENAFGETMEDLVDEKEHLKAALEILQNLEMHHAFDVITEIDVSSLDDLRMQYRGKYQIRLGDRTRLDTKIDAMLAVFEQESFLEAGVVDVSFTDRPDEVIYSPFE